MPLIQAINLYLKDNKNNPIQLFMQAKIKEGTLAYLESISYFGPAGTYYESKSNIEEFMKKLSEKYPNLEKIESTEEIVSLLDLKNLIKENFNLDLTPEINYHRI